MPQLSNSEKHSSSLTFWLTLDFLLSYKSFYDPWKPPNVYVWPCLLPKTFFSWCSASIFNKLPFTGLILVDYILLEASECSKILLFWSGMLLLSIGLTRLCSTLFLQLMAKGFKTSEAYILSTLTLGELMPNLFFVCFDIA